MLYEVNKSKIIHCFLCNHNCRIADGKFGLCSVRQNIDGKLYTLVYGKLAAAHVDPVEKKPLYHFLPGSTSYSVATVGCNFKCGFCQNWQISQTSAVENSKTQETSPIEIVNAAMENGCRSISYTYTEPTIFFEYALDIAREAKKHKLYNIFVSNGYMTKEAAGEIKPYLDAANIDLKSFSDEFYKKTCRARLTPVLDTIKLLKKLNVWLEITTLVIPGENDSEGELNDIARFIAETGKDIPWHISRFHPDYRFNEQAHTPVKTLQAARDIGLKHGLRYVYIGNADGGSDTWCHNCKSLLIRRQYFDILENKIIKGKCYKCSAPIDGHF